MQHNRTLKMHWGRRTARERAWHTRHGHIPRIVKLWQKVTHGCAVQITRPVLQTRWGVLHLLCVIVPEGRAGTRCNNACAACHVARLMGESKATYQHMAGKGRQGVQERPARPEHTTHGINMTNCCDHLQATRLWERGEWAGAGWWSTCGESRRWWWQSGSGGQGYARCAGTFKQPRSGHLTHHSQVPSVT